MVWRSNSERLLAIVSWVFVLSESHQLLGGRLEENRERQTHIKGVDRRKRIRWQT